MNGRLVRRTALDPATTAGMHRLLCRHFVGADEERFLADLAEKNWVILLEDEGGELSGFTTLLMYEERFRGERLAVVYSGDTIVDPAAWSTVALPRTWIRAVRRLHAHHGRGQLWWLLITSGFRTYRFLPVFCRHFHPRYDAPPGDALGALAGHLARRRFGAAYDPASGIVRFARPQRLRDGLRDIPAGRHGDPHVALFARLNPGHADGDELVCVARLDDGNLTRAGLRMLYGGSPAPVAGAAPVAGVAPAGAAPATGAAGP